jgi:2-oxoglutarate dehydrogenase complex dehydrogenase (E1) component-like enzyme
MPHRGRLNVLAAVMGKPYRAIFHEFQGGSSQPSDIEGSATSNTTWAPARTASSTATRCTCR